MKLLKILAVATTLSAASPALAAASVGGDGCATDLTLTAGSSLVSCYARVSGNALNNASNSDINAALTALNYAGPAIVYNSIPGSLIMSGLGGNTNINFPGVFNGTLYLGVHYGNGQGGPGNTTAFYRISASNLDFITLNLAASSTATVLAQVATAVPEPASWALMLAGFGAIGYTLRRRKTPARVLFA